MEAYHERRHHYLPHQLRRMDKQRSGEGDTYWANVCWAPALVSPGCSESQEAAGKPLPQDGSSRPPTQLKLLQSTQWVGAGREWRAQHVGYVGVKDGRQSYRYRHTHQESTEQKKHLPSAKLYLTDMVHDFFPSPLILSPTEHLFPWHSPTVTHLASENTESRWATVSPNLLLPLVRPVYLWQRPETC